MYNVYVKDKAGNNKVAAADKLAQAFLYAHMYTEEGDVTIREGGHKGKKIAELKEAKS